MKYLLESRYHYKVGDLVIIEYWYNNMLSHNLPESEIKGAPDEMVKSSDIIDMKR